MDEDSTSAQPLGHRWECLSFGSANSVATSVFWRIGVEVLNFDTLKSPMNFSGIFPCLYVFSELVFLNLGSGSFGKIYYAINSQNGQEVAVKTEDHSGAWVILVGSVGIYQIHHLF